MHIPTWAEVLTPLFQRYHQMASAHRLDIELRLGKDLVDRTIALCEHAMADLKDPSIGEDKANRWLGFVQGVLIAGGATSIEEERDHTRPHFHSLHGVAPSHDVRGGN